MKKRSEAWIFMLTLGSATAVLVSLTVAQILLALAGLTWILFRPRQLHVPRYCLPIAGLLALTLLSQAMSDDPAAGAPAIRKFVLFAMGILTVNVVRTERRVRLAYRLVISAAVLSSILGLVQFGFAYRRYLETGSLADDPTVLARATGFLGHWMSYGGQMLLVWCAAVPLIVILGRRWLIPVVAIGVAILFGFTRSVWLGAVAGLLTGVFRSTRAQLVRLLLPIALIAAAASPLIYHRLSMSLEEGFGPDVGRLANIEAGLGMIREHPWLGVGPGRVGVEFPRYYDGGNLESFYYGHLHNNFLQIAAERGLPSLLMFVWFLLELYRVLLHRAASIGGLVSLLSVSGLAALSGFVIAGLFEFNFGDSEVLLLMLFLVSVPLALDDDHGVEVAALKSDAHSAPA